MAESKKLCYSTKQSGRPLCYKKNNSSRPLIYKADGGKETTGTGAGPRDARDLDIHAYWTGAPELTAGFSHGNGGTSGVYSLKYSGDVTSEAGSEWCKIKMSPWGGSNARTFRVHFNFYGHDEEHPGTSVTVIASQPGGKTLMLNTNGSAGSHRAANSGDPSCTVTFDESGKLVSLT